MAVPSDTAGTEGAVNVDDVDDAAASAEEDVAVDVVSASLFHVIACC